MLPKYDVSISIKKANIVVISTVFPIVGIFFVLPFALIWGLDSLMEGIGSFGAPWSIFPALILGTVVHELLHGACFAFWGKTTFRVIKFGIKWKSLTPYAACKVPISARAYRIAAFTPGFTMGIVPAVVAIAIGNGWLLWFGTVFTAAAGGDFLALWMTRKVEWEQLVEDHPKRVGVMFTKPLPVANLLTAFF